MGRQRVVLDVDTGTHTGGSAAWGATVLDRRGRYATSDAGTWSLALGVDRERHLAGVRAWLQGGR